MKKSSPALKKIVLNNETIRILTSESLHEIVAGITQPQTGKGIAVRRDPLHPAPQIIPTTCN
jgi:hypothetical protein